MKDDITREYAKRKHIKNLKIMGLFFGAIIFLLVFIVILLSVPANNYKDFTEFFHCTFAAGGFPTEYGDGDFISDSTAKGCVCVLTDKTVNVVKTSGGLLMSLEHGLTEPVMKTGDNRVLLYSSSGKSFKVYNRKELLLSSLSDSKIISGAVSDKGRFMLLTLNSEYSCVLNVYKKNCDLSFKWYCAEGFPLAVYCGKDCEKAAVVTLNAENGIAKSVVYIIDLQKRKETGTFELDGIVLNGALSSEGISLITQNGAGLYSTNGTELGFYSFDAGELLYSQGLGEADFAVVLGDKDRWSSNKLVCLSRKCVQVFCLELGIRVDALSYTSERISILSSNMVYTYSPAGSLKATYNTEDHTLDITDHGGPIAITRDKAIKLVRNAEDKK